MGARRARFTKDERAVFTPGTEIEFLNGTRWRPARVAGGFETDSIGGEFVGITVPGVPMARRGYPKGIRLPEEVRAGRYV